MDSRAQKKVTKLTLLGFMTFKDILRACVASALDLSAFSATDIKW